MTRVDQGRVGRLGALDRSAGRRGSPWRP
jgi:hypothetical protein